MNEQPYWTDVAAKAFNIVANSAKGDDAYNIWDPTLGSKGLHAKGMGERVVRWGRENDKAASEWKFVSVEVDEDALKQAQAEYAAYEAKVKAFEEEYAYLSGNVEKFETTLAKYFEDAACTVLKPAYSTLGDEALRNAMAADALPATLVDMAIKVKNGDWSEANEVSDKKGWDSDYAKKFRVQLIEPYSIAGEITSWFGHNAHTNMDNPTGLYTNNCQVAYIMVEGEIAVVEELKSYIAEAYGNEPFVKFTLNREVEKLCASKEAFEVLMQPMSPDHIVYCKAIPMFIECFCKDCIKEKFNAFVKEHGYAPKIVFSKGVGMFAIGNNE